MKIPGPTMAVATGADDATPPTPAMARPKSKIASMKMHTSHFDDGYYVCAANHTNVSSPPGNDLPTGFATAIDST